MKWPHFLLGGFCIGTWPLLTLALLDAADPNGWWFLYALIVHVTFAVAIWRIRPKTKEVEP